MLQLPRWYPSNEQDALEVLFERLLTRPKKLSWQLRPIGQSRGDIVTVRVVAKTIGTPTN
jgi:hypothetical protein